MVISSAPLSCTSHQPLPLHDRSGNIHCYNCIIETYQTQGYNLARRMLNDWALAEDALQESFLSGYRAFHQFRGENLKAWMMRVVANTCRDMLRARRSRPTAPLDPVPSRPEDPASGPSAVDLPSSQESPEEHAERQELNHVIQAGIASLPEGQRLAVLLVDAQGFEYEEAASAMNCSLGTVKSRLSRGRRHLRDFLRNSGELLPDPFRREV